MTQIGGESPLQATKAKIQAIIRQAKIDTQEREIKRRQTAEKHQQDGKALQQEAALEELRGREKGQSAIEAAKASAADSQAQQAFDRQWGRSYSTQDWNRLYHYPYVWYPQNFWGQDYYRSSEDLYYRYPPEMRIPVYNRSWQNYYPQARKYHKGHQFILDVF